MYSLSYLQLFNPPLHFRNNLLNPFHNPPDPSSNLLQRLLNPSNDLLPLLNILSILPILSPTSLIPLVTAAASACTILIPLNLSNTPGITGEIRSIFPKAAYKALTFSSEVSVSVVGGGESSRRAL